MTYRNLPSLFFAFIFSLSGFAANQLTIVSDSKSDYQIVIPDKAKNAGIDTGKMEDWEYVLKTDGKDIYIIGKDIKGPKDPETLKNPWRYTPYALGTPKAVTAFLENYAGTRFVMPGPNGVSVEKKTVIEVPDNLNTAKKPLFKYCIVFQTLKSRSLFIRNLSASLTLATIMPNFPRVMVSKIVNATNARNCTGLATSVKRSG